LNVDKEIVHLEVTNRLESLDALISKVILGFIIFWVSWAIALLITLGYMLIGFFV